MNFLPFKVEKLNTWLAPLKSPNPEWVWQVMWHVRHLRVFEMIVPYCLLGLDRRKGNVRQMTF